MSDDPIVDEIRRVRHAHAAQFDDDLSAIVADIRRLQRERPEPYQPPAFGTGRAATAICTEPTSDADVTRGRGQANGAWTMAVGVETGPQLVWARRDSSILAQLIAFPFEPPL